ncbi:porin [Phyllobacterium sp. 21LDTY02-6]|uniref:porin n=1 Tax=unclassified Phyllobacterium TaxID=2638441 RepID=UPI0020218C7C|nr:MULTISPECIES: porin [unclassified Phyllobacterium]MCO4319833.1 porin [Phyllobacterium sp. 21LDTY02-6]MCX8280573.1 porin [Phyllobacterium sp. 0TCS1.6C]MCX8294978.1 porin [Phyllobacterium sp. 0TCS1.6A]
MNIKSLLLGSAAVLVAATGARAADAVVVAEPEPVEYVRVCDTYGAGFFYIPGTETCLKIDGYVRVDVKGGDLLGRNTDTDAEIDSYKHRSRGVVRFDARSDTELGTLRSYIATEFTVDEGADSVGLPHAFIELGGFRIGVTDSVFGSWTGGGNVINDDLIDYDGDKTNQVNYTFAGGNGFSAVIGLEQGDKDHLVTDYMPHVVAGAKFKQAWGAISGVVGYDSVVEEFAGKLRLDANFSDSITGFIMAGYQSDAYTKAKIKNYYGAWSGDWAVWGGLSAKVSDKATINGQLAYTEAETIAASLNVDYELVHGFVITPEIDYKDEKKTKDQFGGIIRFQRNF